MSDPLSNGDAAYRASLRRHTLNALRYADGGAADDDAITLDPSAIERERLGARPIGISPRRQYNAPGWSPTLPPDQPPAPLKPAPAPPPDTTFKPDRDLQLGFQSGTADVARMLAKPAEDLYGGRLAGGKPLSEAMTESLAPDEQEMAAHSAPFSRALQLAGRMPADALRYGMTTAAAGGNPILGGYAAEALGANTPQEAEERGEMGAALPGAFHELPGLAAELKSGLGQLGRYLPTQAELQAARAAADARLRASGVYGTRAAMGPAPDTLRDLAISTGAQLGSGLYTAGEAAAARARQVTDWITNKQATELTPQEQDLFHQAQQASPELAQISDKLMPLEVRKIIASPENVESVSRMLRVIPDSYKLAAAAKMGVSKLGWYRGSSQALVDVFGDDAPRFAQLLAATSPQTSVESNLQNALNIWKNWTAEGRPTDPAAIRRIMGASVQGNKGEKSVLDAWLNNSTNVLSAKDPTSITLSGPKVDSFYRNLRDDVFRVTNDAWMANALGLAQDAFSGSPSELQLARGDPGMTWRYAAASARLRDASLKAGMLPSQGQETIWSTAMQLYELAKREGLHPREVLERGMLTPEVIRGAPDFSTLLKDPRYARILEDAGYGQQLHAMQPFQFPETSVPMSAAEQEHMGAIADILGQTAELRDRVGRSQVFQPAPSGPGQLPTTAFVREQAEATPGRITGHFPGMTDLPYGQREYYTRAAFAPFRDPRGRDVLQTATGLASVPMEPAIGSFKERGKPWDVNPARSLGVEAPLTWTAQPGEPPRPAIAPDVMANVRGVAATRGAMLGQAAVGLPALVENPAGASFRMQLPEKPPLAPETMRQLSEKYPKMAFAHTGEGIEALDINKLNLSDAQRKNMGKLVRAATITNADNIGDYINYAKDWAQKPGSGAVTQHMLSHIDQMTPDAQAALDQAVRQPAGDLASLYDRYAKSKKLVPRADLMNLLATMRDQGIAGVRAGIKSGAFLPGLAGAFLAPHLLRGPSPETSALSGPDGLR